MNISGIRTSSGFYDYNTIKNSEVKSQQSQEPEEIEALGKPIEEPEESGRYLIAAGTDETREELGNAESAKQTEPAKQTVFASQKEFVSRYQPNAVYEFKGIDSDLFSLDVEKAVSDMKKDQVLQQYQFFIGESQAGEDLAKIRENENFTI